MSVDDNTPVSQDELAASQRQQNVNFEGARSARALNLEASVEAKAVDLAVKSALREAKVDAALQSHEARLDRLNGSLERVNGSLSGLDKRMSEFIAVGEAVAHKSVSTRAFVMTMLTIAVPAAGYALTTVH